MKIRNLLILAVIVTAIGFFGCGGDDDPPQQTTPPTTPPAVCSCDPKAHLGVDETCSCGGTGCDCTLQVYLTLDGVPVYRKGAATDISEAIAKLQEAYDNLQDNAKLAFPTKIARIVLIPDSDDRVRTPEDGKWVIELGANRSAASMSIFLNNAISDPVAMAKSNDARLANVYQTTSSCWFVLVRG